MRHRYIQIGAALALVAILAVVRLRGDDSPTPRAATPLPPFSAQTISKDGKPGDVDIRFDPATRQASIVRAAAPLIPGIPQAPLFAQTWESRPVREGTVQTWCLNAADAEAQDVFRAVLTQLAARFPKIGSGPGFAWRESCNGATYYLTADAYDHCGIGDNAVACASPDTYCGRDSQGDAWCGGKVSYNGHYRAYTTSGGRVGLSPGLDRTGLGVALAHEVQHLVLSLDHVACGQNPDPLTGRSVPSAMAAVYLPSGPTCTSPGATGLTPDDWGLAIRYYGFAAAGPQPTPPPTPTPTPPAVVALQRWVEASKEPCNTPSGEWCIVTVQTKGSEPAGAYYVVVKVAPDGALSYPGGFEFIGP